MSDRLKMLASKPFSFEPIVRKRRATSRGPRMVLRAEARRLPRYRPQVQGAARNCGHAIRKIPPRRFPAVVKGIAELSERYSKRSRALTRNRQTSEQASRVI